MVVGIFHEKLRPYFCIPKNESFFQITKNMIFFSRLNHTCSIKPIKLNHCRPNGLYGKVPPIMQLATAELILCLVAQFPIAGNLINRYDSSLYSADHLAYR